MNGYEHGLIQPLELLIRAVADDIHADSAAAFSRTALNNPALDAGTAHGDTVSASLWSGFRNGGTHGSALFMSGTGLDSVQGGDLGLASFGNSTLTGAQSGAAAAAGTAGPTVQGAAGHFAQFLGSAGTAADFDPGRHATFVTGNSPAHHGAVPTVTQTGTAPLAGGHSVRLSDGTEITFASLTAHHGGHAT